MGFREAETYLDSLGIDAMKKMAPSLHRIEALCDLLNHPERVVPALHITGTNGKTSVARIATSLLQATGLTVATFTSPHLETVRERLALAGQPISEDDFGSLFDHLVPYLEVVEKELEEPLTYFEVLTAMFYLWAAEAPVDVMVVEVGLGGRWDATNLVHATVAVVTNVALDHVELLGSDRETIAREKSGVIKQQMDVVCGERDPRIVAIVEEAAAATDAPVSLLDRDFRVVENLVAVGGRRLEIETSRATYDDLYLSLHGGHQGVNAAVALEAVTRFLPARRLDVDVVLEGLATVTAPGRLELVRPATETSAAVVLDVAHNPDGMSALVTSLQEAFAFETVTFVLGVLADKDLTGILAEVARVPCSLVLAAPASPRAVPVAELAKAADRAGLPWRAASGVGAGVALALEDAAPTDLVCVTGSHYVVGDARALLGER